MRQLNDVEFISSTQIIAVGDKFGANFTVIYSTNGGMVWNDATVAGIAVGDGCAIARTAVSGVNWVEESGATIKNLAALAMNGNTVIAVGTKGGANFNVVRSTDGGDTWAAPFSLPDVDVNLAAVAFGDKGGWHLHCHSQRRRGRIILLLAEGEPISEISRIVGIERRHIYKWAKQFVTGGTHALRDRPGRGRKRTIHKRAGQTRQAA